MIEQGEVYGISYSILQGDAMAPEGSDILAALGLLRTGAPVPEGWRVLSGSFYNSSVAAIGYRYEFEEMREP